MTKHLENAKTTLIPVACLLAMLALSTSAAIAGPSAKHGPAAVPTVGIASAAELQFLKVTNVPLDGTAPGFQLVVDCDEAAQVSSVYAKITDPDFDIDVEFISVSMLSDIFMDGVSPTFWQIAHLDFDPPPSSPAGVTSTSGYELMSQLAVEAPVGIPPNGRFSILGNRTAASGNETISFGAVVEAEPGTCDVMVIDL